MTLGRLRRDEYGGNAMHDDSEHVEQIFRIEAMKGELEEISHGQMLIGDLGEELPPEMEEQFLAQVLAYEQAEQVKHRELLARDGVALPAPDEMNDDELALKLIEVIHALAARRMFLEHTNHFSDRELYTHLWEDALEEWGPILPPDNEMNCHIDLVGSGSDDDTRLYLTYYADEDTRVHWAQDDPELEMPAQQTPPYDRDRHLPKPPEPPNPYDDPEFAAAWWAKCREALVRQLTADGISDVAIDDEPISYAPDLACVWGAAHPHSPDTVAWWAISGDVPTTYLAAADIPDPRTFLRLVSRHWRAASDAMESGAPPAELIIGARKDWPRIIPLLRRRAEILEDWAEDDDAWEEE